jgi:Bacterial extracellular solute-binding protein
MARHRFPRRTPAQAMAGWTVQGRHRSARAGRRWALATVVAATVGVSLVAALLARDPTGDAGTGGADAATSCPQRVRVLTASSFAPVLDSVAGRLRPDDCLRVEVTVADGRSAGRRVSEADVWIPDDAAWAGTAEGRLLAQDGVAGSGTVVAASPIYMATDRATATRIERAGGTWAALAGLLTSGSGVRLAVRDPAGSGDGMVAAGDLAEAVWNADGMNASALALAKTLRVTRTVTDGGPALPQQPGEVGLVPEYALLSALDGAAAGAGPALLGGRDNTAVLRYSWLPTVAAVSDSDRAAALRRLLLALSGPDGIRALAVAGLRRPTGGSAPDALRDRLPELPELDAKPFEVLEPHHVHHVFATWYRQDRRANLLIAVDVSSSMGDPAAGTATPLMDLVRGGCLSVGKLLPDDALLGLWEFGADIDPPRDYRAVLPARPMTEAHRRALAAAVAKLATRSTETGLYDTILAAYRASLEGYRPGMPNQVLVFTDGRNEDDPASLTATRLADELAAAADPARPVQLTVVALGERPEVGVLETAVKPIDGYVDAVANAGDISAVFTHVVAGGLHQQ